MFNQQRVKSNSKENIKAHQWISLYKLWKVFPCYDVTMNEWQCYTVINSILNGMPRVFCALFNWSYSYWWMRSHIIFRFASLVLGVIVSLISMSGILNVAARTSLMTHIQVMFWCHQASHKHHRCWPTAVTNIWCHWATLNNAVIYHTPNTYYISLNRNRQM